MKKNKRWKAIALNSLVMLQLSSVLLPSLAYATEMTPETESSQVVEEVIESEEVLPIEEETSEEIVEEVEEVEVPVIEDETQPVEVIPEEEAVEDEEENIEEQDIIKEQEPALEESIEENVEEKKEEIPQMRTFSMAATKNVNYIAFVYKGTNTIDSLPWGEPGFKQIGSTKDYVGQAVRITKHSENGAYGYAHFEGIGNGWVDLKALKVMDVLSVDYSDYVTAGNYEVDTLPWGTSGFQKVGTTAQYVGHQLQIRYKTTNNAYLYAELNGQAIGWIDAKAFGLAGNEYTAIIKNGRYNVDTLPWGTPGYQTVSLTKDYMGMELLVKGTTQNGSYLLVYQNNEKVGWVDKRSVEPFVTKPVNYSDYIGSGKYNIDTLPYGTPGFRKIGNTNLLLGNYVTVTRESANGAYAYVTLNNVGQGWIDKRALGVNGTSYPATIVSGKYSVDTLPWGTPGFAKKANTSDYVGKELLVKGTTDSGHYALAYLDGAFLGWIDKKALKPMNYKTVNYSLEVSGGQYEIDTLPWGDYGFKKVGNTAPYVGLSLAITKESSNGAYVYANLNGKGLGWIDKKAFGFNKLSYSFYITNGSYNLDTLPWGTLGYKNIGLTESLKGKELEVVAATQNGAYLKVAHSGKVLGWIDSKAGKKLNEKIVNYTGTISNSGYTIDTLPWGTPGFANRGKSANHLGKKVVVSKESADGHYLFISEAGGAAMGWVDKKALKFKNTVFLDVGHGGSDSGAYYYGVKEKDINLNVSMKLKKQLEDAGYTVIMSRTNDIYIDHKTKRSEMANSSGADIFVSVHHNAMPGNSYVNGIETFYYKYDPDYPSVINGSMHNDPNRLLKSAALANEIHNSLIKSTGAFNRGVRRDTFAVLRETSLPAVLLELGFMSNQSELNKLTTNSYQDKLAQAVKKGIDSYFQTR